MAIRLNLGAGAHELKGFVNRGPENDGWRFEDGLGDYADGSVEALTISHALMHLPLERWGRCFAEFARVLQPNGVIRITEDATDDPKSERYGGFPGAVVLTSYALVATHLTMAGLQPYWMPPDESGFEDDSLIQNHHGRPPKIFVIEAVKP